MLAIVCGSTAFQLALTMKWSVERCLELSIQLAIASFAVTFLFDSPSILFLAFVGFEVCVPHACAGQACMCRPPAVTGNRWHFHPTISLVTAISLPVGCAGHRFSQSLCVYAFFAAVRIERFDSCDNRIVMFAVAVLIDVPSYTRVFLVPSIIPICFFTSFKQFSCGFWFPVTSLFLWGLLYDAHVPCRSSPVASIFRRSDLFAGKFSRKPIEQGSWGGSGCHLIW